MTPAAKEGLPAVVGELVAEMRAVAEAIHASSPEHKARRMRDWADRLSALTAEAGKGEEVAKIVNKFGDPERFAERELVITADIQKLPIGTKLYAALSTATPAGEWVLVPREPTQEMMQAAHPGEPMLLRDTSRLRKQWVAMLVASPRGASAGGE
jgi:hypothetical protein